MSGNESAARELGHMAVHRAWGHAVATEGTRASRHLRGTIFRTTGAAQAAAEDGYTSPDLTVEAQAPTRPARFFYATYHTRARLCAYTQHGTFQNIPLGEVSSVNNWHLMDADVYRLSY